jgi:hypothetical protein
MVTITSFIRYVLAHLPAEVPLTTVDLTSAQRVHFWKSRATADALRKGLSILHKAINWTEHFAWAGCILSELSERRGNLTSRGHRCSAGFPQLSRACKRSSRCPAHYNAFLGHHRTWCSADESLQYARRRPPLVALPQSFCDASSPTPICDYIVARASSARPVFDTFGRKFQ